MNKESLQRKVEQQLRTWDETADELAKKLAAAGDDVRAEYQQHIEAAKKKQEALRQRLDELSSARADAWEDLKKGVDDAWADVEAAWADVRKGVEKASARFSEKRKPTSASS